jgi:hypothetical protein
MLSRLVRGFLRGQVARRAHKVSSQLVMVNLLAQFAFRCFRRCLPHPALLHLTFTIDNDSDGPSVKELGP